MTSHAELERDEHNWLPKASNTYLIHKRYEIDLLPSSFCPWRRQWQPTPVFLPGGSTAAAFVQLTLATVLGGYPQTFP